MKKTKPFAITLDPGSSLANKTGNWRTERPVYVNLLPPCNEACAAGEDIQGWLYQAEEGNYQKAWEILMRDNPFPAIMGRVCWHPCETACNRARLDQAVNIHAIERFLGDEAVRKKWKVEVPKPFGGKAAIVGGGPSGLAAAYHLVRLGVSATVFEAGPKLGGMMRLGIPKYRLPRRVVDAEIDRLLNMGVKAKVNSLILDVEKLFQKKGGGFDAVFIAIGAHLSQKTEIPAKDARKMIDALSFLREVETGTEPPKIGRRVAIYGGGDTAMDAARTAKRLGAEEAIIIYRRDRAHMRAHDSEAEEAIREGVLIHWLRTIKKIEKEEITVEVMKLDERGYPKPTGTFETLKADALILALGQDVQSDFLKKVPGVQFKEDGVVEVDEAMRTGYEGLFAGGDMVPAERTVTTAVGHGKKAARHIHAYLKGKKYVKPPAAKRASFDLLNTWYYTDASRSKQKVLDLSRRKTGFEEYVKGLTEETALWEARRCLSCGNCFECDNCYGICPDNAVIKLNPGKHYQFNYDFCKGCGLCSAECPCHAIEMVPERK